MTSHEPEALHARDTFPRVSLADPLQENLRHYRSAHNLSQAALADKAGLSRSVYRDIERGKATPRLDSLRRIAEALSISVPNLLAPMRKLSRVRYRPRRKP